MEVFHLSYGNIYISNLFLVSFYFDEFLVVMNDYRKFRISIYRWVVQKKNIGTSINQRYLRKKMLKLYEKSYNDQKR